MSDERRAFGQLEGKVEMLESDMRELKTDIRAIREILAEARGGWHVMVAIGGFSATLGSALTWVTQHLWKQ